MIEQISQDQNCFFIQIVNSHKHGTTFDRWSRCFTQWVFPGKMTFIIRIPSASNSIILKILDMEAPLLKLGVFGLDIGVLLS